MEFFGYNTSPLSLEISECMKPSLLFESPINIKSFHQKYLSAFFLFLFLKRNMSTKLLYIVVNIPCHIAPFSFRNLQSHFYNNVLLKKATYLIPRPLSSFVLQIML